MSQEQLPLFVSSSFLYHPGLQAEVNLEKTEALIVSDKTGYKTCNRSVLPGTILHALIYCFVILIIVFSFTFALSVQHKKVRTYCTGRKLQSGGSTYTCSMFYDIRKKMRSEVLTLTGKLTMKEKEWKYWYQNGQLARIEHYKLLINKDHSDLPDTTSPYCRAGEQHSHYTAFSGIIKKLSYN